MKKRKVILVGSKDRTKVKRRRRRIGTFTAEVSSYVKAKIKAMSPWERIKADVAKLA